MLKDVSAVLPSVRKNGAYSGNALADSAVLSGHEVLLLPEAQEVKQPPAFLKEGGGGLYTQRKATEEQKE